MCVGEWLVDHRLPWQQPDRTLAVRSVSICVRKQQRTFGNLANHSSPITERSRSFATQMLTERTDGWWPDPVGPGTIFIKHLRENLKLGENFGIEWQQNQRTLEILIIILGCNRSNSVYVFINSFQKVYTLRKLKEISLFLVFYLRCFINVSWASIHKET